LTLSSLTLPTWGGLHDGVLFEHPTLERLTSEPGYSSLPTPTAQAAKHMTMDDRGEGTHDDHNLWSVASRLLPTPTASRMEKNETPDEWVSRSIAMNHYATLPLGVAVTHMVTTHELGARMRQQSTDGNTSWDAPHQPPLFSKQDTSA